MHDGHVSHARQGDAGSAWDGRVRHLGAHAYGRLLAGARVLEADAHGPKVLRTPGGLICKVFRRKRWLSSALWRPYAVRFAQNARALAERGVPTVRVRRVWHCPAHARHVVAYPFLPGTTLRERAAQAPPEAADWQRLGRFVAALHRRGVYFRSLHLGNVVVGPDGDFGLIDVADLRVYPRPLGVRARARNFRHLLRDSVARATDARQVWTEAYLHAVGADLSVSRHARLARAVAAIRTGHGE